MTSLRKKIGIDARFYGPIGKGLGRYTQEVVDGVTRINNENDFVIFLRKENFYDFIPANENVKKVLADVGWYTFLEQVLMPYYIWKERVDLMHFPHFNVPVLCPVKFIVTVHDLILIHFPTKRASTLGPVLYFIKNLAYRFNITLAIRRAKKIITVSDYVKKDIISLFKLPTNKVIVTYNGVSGSVINIDEKLDDKKVILGYNITKPYLLYVGNAYPHKNLESLLEIASNNIIFDNIQLVLVGKDDYFYSRLKKIAEQRGLWNDHGLSSRVIFAGYVPDGELSMLYKNSLAYIFPSFYEGFGIPPLEAMSWGVPVISSNKTSMPEILGDAAMYFDPKNSSDMVEKILLVINDQDIRNKLKQEGYIQCEKYKWEDCVNKTVELYKEVLK